MLKTKNVDGNVSSKGNEADEKNPEQGGSCGTRSEDEGTTSKNMCSASNSANFMEAFAFLKQSAEQQYKECFTEGTSSTLSALGSGSAIIVNPCQRGNPVLEHIHNIPMQFADKDAKMAPDYIMSPSTCCLFLSFRYHALRPNYIYERIQALRRTGQFSLRILLCLVDVKEPAYAVKELAKAALISDMTLLLAFSNEEAGTYIQTFKSFKNKPADIIQKKSKKEHSARLVETLSSAKSINTTNAHTVLSNFKNFAEVAAAKEYELALLPGLGGLRAKRLHDLFVTPFLKSPPP